MSDLATTRRLTPASCQLPVSWYFDTEIFALEKKRLFDAGPYQSPLEDAELHFHEWLLAKLGR